MYHPMEMENAHEALAMLKQKQLPRSTNSVKGYFPIVPPSLLLHLPHPPLLLLIPPSSSPSSPLSSFTSLTLPFSSLSLPLPPPPNPNPCPPSSPPPPPPPCPPSPSPSPPSPSPSPPYPSLFLPLLPLLPLPLVLHFPHLPQDTALRVLLVTLNYEATQKLQQN